MFEMDDDPHAQAVASLSLATRSSIDVADAIDLARIRARHVAAGHGPWAGMAASIALFAAAICAVRSGSAIHCAEVRRLARELARDRSETARALSVDRLLSEFC